MPRQALGDPAASVALAPVHSRVPGMAPGRSGFNDCWGGWMNEPMSA